jgi:hypothetical protein
MPLDTARAQQKSFVFAELVAANPTDPITHNPYNWQERQFQFQPPDAAFLARIPAFEEVLSVRLQQMSGYFEVFLYNTNESYVFTSVGTISRQR